MDAPSFVSEVCPPPSLPPPLCWRIKRDESEASFSASWDRSEAISDCDCSWVARESSSSDGRAVSRSSGGVESKKDRRERGVA